jgi:hypothetical protein
MLIVARGPDLAGRTPEALMVDKIDESPYQVYAVTVSKGDDTRLPELLGPAGHAQVKYFENLEVGFAEVARRVESDYGRYYFLSYCSPARAGERQLTISVSTRDGDGDEVKGDTSVPFNAAGFTSGCDSSRPPLRRNAGRDAGKAVVPSVETAPAGPSAADSSAGNASPADAAGTGSGQTDVVPPPRDGAYAD